MNKGLRARSESPPAQTSPLDAESKAFVEAPEGTPSLARRINEGDREAETELVRRFSRPALAVLLNHGLDSSTARDILQDTLLHALVTLRGSDPRSDEETFRLLLGTAHFLAKNARRKALRRQCQPQMNVEVEVIADAEPGPDEALDRAQRLHLAKVAVTRLVAVRDRELLDRHFLRGDSREQLQTEFGWTPVQFNKVLSRALSRVKAILTGRSRDQNESAHQDPRHSAIPSPR